MSRTVSGQIGIQAASHLVFGYNQLNRLASRHGQEDPKSEKKTRKFVSDF
jgi:hypothetical protein